MSIRQIKNYLDKIGEAKPINYPKFKKLVGSLGLPYELNSSTVYMKKIKRDLYEVRILSNELEDALKKFTELNYESRVSLASQNKSHYQKVSGSMLICRKGQEHPYVVVFDREGNYQSPISCDPKTSCLIIENLENFLFVQNTLDSLSSDSLLVPNQISDLIFSDGKAITNSLHHEFLSSFDRLFLFLDLDRGGLKIAASLKKSLPQAEMVFLISQHTKTMLSNVVSMESPEYLKEVEVLGRDNPFLYDAATLILEYRKTIEQEAFLI